MPPPQLVDHLRARIIFEAAQVLQAESANRLDLFIVKPGTQHHVGKQLQRRLQVGSQRRRGNAHVQGLGAFPMADSQVVERRQPLPTIPRARPTRHPLGHHRGRAAPHFDSVGNLVGSPRRDQEREGRRLHAGHHLADEHKPIGKLMLLDRRGC